MGWFDAVASRYGCRIQGATEVALTVLDVLGYLDELPVCVGYEIDGEITRDFPCNFRLAKQRLYIKCFRAGRQIFVELKNMKTFLKIAVITLSLLKKNLE